MATKRKEFRIGECAIGGIIEVTINGKVVQIRALDYNSKKEVMKGTTDTTQRDAYRQIDDFLTELTTYYFTQKVMDYIKGNVTFKNEFEY